MKKLSVVLITGLSSATTDLTQETFESTVFAKQDKGWFVKFYAPWCPHC